MTRPIKTVHKSWPEPVIDAIAAVLAATGHPGLTGTEIGQLLERCRVPDLDALASKRHRLARALIGQQQRQGASNCVIRFLTESMAPARYLSEPERFRQLQRELAAPLSLVGMRINDKGQVARAGTTASTLDEVAELAGALQTELVRRQTHPQVLAYCRAELLRDSLFHATFEAVKGLGQRLRDILGVGLDGEELITSAFAARGGTPRLTINAHQTRSEQSEQAGFANLVKGLFGTFRNPPAHTPRSSWPVAQIDLLDLFATLSYVHRRLDGAVLDSS